MSEHHRRQPSTDQRCAFALTALIGALALLNSSPYAQAFELPLPSPKARVEQRVGIADFSLEYSSPAVRGRTIWGGVVALDKRWRSGANKATKLTASHEFIFGGQAVPAGAYALYTIPGRDTWTVVLNSDADVWGMPGPDPAHDLVRVTAKAEAVPFRERLTFIFSEATDDSVRLDLEWEKLRISVPIKVDTQAHIGAAAGKLREEAWEAHTDSARYLLENGGDLGIALAYVDTSIAIDSTWANHWLRAQILGKQGRTAQALEAAQQALRLGRGDKEFEEFYQPQVEKAIREWNKKKG